MGKQIRINLHSLIDERNISMRELGRLADIRHATLIELANGKRQNIHLEHILKIAEALDITDVNEIICIVEIED